MTEIDIPEPDAVDGAPHPRFSTRLFGQQQAEATFLDAHSSGRVHHAWLITGPRGVGKATLAWRIARYLLASNNSAPHDLTGADGTEPGLDMAPETPIFRKVGGLAEPRLILCRRPWDPKAERLKQDITVEEVRKLKGFFNLSAADGGQRVAIIDAAEDMNTNAANALLKILEEPPAEVTFLLISHQPAKLLPTIQSRCRSLVCRQLNSKDMQQALDNIDAAAGDDSNALNVLADGSVGEALRLIQSNGIDAYRALISLYSKAPGINRTLAIELAESCVGKTATARYDMILRLIPIFLARLARTGINGSPDLQVGDSEALLLARLSPNQTAAQAWAELSQTLVGRATHGRAVNLDPASVILDMLLAIDKTAAVSVRLE